MDPVVPFIARRIDRHGFEHYRRRTLSLYAALKVGTGEAHGKVFARHPSGEFVDFLGQVALRHPDKKIHIMIDCVRKAQKVQAFLQDHTQVKRHFTSTYWS